jgi:hypothetical protein
VAGAEVGSLATGAGDRWSDLDLTFSVEDGLAIGEVLEDFTRGLVDSRGAVQLFDLPFESTIYRVFLLGSLQFDLSFTPASSSAREARTAASFEETPVRSVEPEELLRALRGVVDALLREQGDAHDLAAKLQGQLEELVRY